MAHLVYFEQFMKLNWISLLAFFHCHSLRKQEIPIHKKHKQNSYDRHNNSCQHVFFSYTPSLIFFSLNELETTDTELKAMATEAMMGLNKIPKNG